MTTHLTADLLKQTFKTHYSVLLRYAYSLLKEEAAAQDVVSEVFYQLWLNKEIIRINANLRGYLFACTKHQAFKVLRARKSQSAEGDADLHAVPAAEASPFETLVSGETAEWLENLIARLPPPKPGMIELKLFGLTNREVAEVLGVSEKKVEYHLGTAVELLRRDIKRSGVAQELLLDAALVLNILVTVN